MTQELLSKKMFPVSLLLEGRSCVVVGGGRVAARKARKLVAAGATVTVIAPVIREAIRTLSNIQLLERPFDRSDLEGAYLVFATTDQPEVNREIIECCHQQKIICSAADRGWADSDFILPASFSSDGLTVAISTGGRSCRRSRLLRESLSRHVEFLQDVDLFIWGADHTSVDFQTLENLKARRSDIEKLLPNLRGLHEFMILDTCNRFEIIGLISANTDIKSLLKGPSHLVKGEAAFRRFSELAAGLHSQVFGETRIVAQIKEALAVAQDHRWAGRFLRGWVDTTLCISKEIRQTVEPHITPVEIEDLAFQWATALRPTNILLVGRGEIGQGLLKKFPQAIQISGRDDDELRDQLSIADIVICATGSPEFVIGEAHRSLLQADVSLIDLSLPRNIDPALPGVVGLSELRGSIPLENEQDLRRKARNIMDDHTADYERLMAF